MRRNLWISLVAIVVVAVTAITVVLVSNSHPVLGLDLRGGVSVVLQPDRKVDGGQLNEAVNIIRNRVDALGVAEPDITAQGSKIVISLPGVKDPDNALKLVGQTAELRFRPVLGSVPPFKEATTSTTAPGATTTSAAGATTTTTAAPNQDGSNLPTTSRAEDLPESQVVLPQLDKSGTPDVRYILGPTSAVGNVVKGATATPPQLAGDWTVDVTFTGE